MTTTINARDLRANMARVVREARQGHRFTVLYRSRVAFEIVPPHSDSTEKWIVLEKDAVYRSGPLGASSDGRAARDHDRALYT